MIADAKERNGAVAQLGERRVRNAKVRGSIPLGSTMIPARDSVGTWLLLLVPGFSRQFPKQIVREAGAGSGIRGRVSAAPRHLRQLIGNQYRRRLDAGGFQYGLFIPVHAQTPAPARPEPAKNCTASDS